MPANKLSNRNIQGTRLDPRAVGALTVKGNTLANTGLAACLFNVHGVVATGIYAIAALNHGSASSRTMARQLLRGKLPRGMTATILPSIAWLELRARAHSDAKCAVSERSDALSRHALCITKHAARCRRNETK